MTAICGGGTSSPRPGVSQTIFISSSAAGALLNNVPTAWAVPLAGYIGALTYNATTFCTIDPPADPGITALDIANLLNIGNPLAGLSAAQKVAQLVSRYAWYQFCQCDSVATPAPPAPPDEPAGSPKIDPPYLPSTKAGPCTDIQGMKTQVDASNFTNYMIGKQGAASDATRARLAPGATLLRWTSTYDKRPQPTFTYNMVITVYDSAGAVILSRSNRITSADTNPPAVFTETVAVPAGATWADAVWASSGGGGQTVTGTVRLEFFCGTTPNTPQLECCPPDAGLAAKLEQILGYVTLIQRQIAPFAFIDGPAHAGLQNFGQIVVASPLIGVKVNLTTIPGSMGLSPGNPDFHFDCGYVSLGDADGWFAERRLSVAETVWQPRWSGAVTRIGYTLHPGVIASITELRREP